MDLIRVNLVFYMLTFRILYSYSYTLESKELGSHKDT